MKMCIVLCLSVRVCYLPIIAECYLQMLFFLLFSDLYSNQIKLYSHNYTTLPKALTRMWVFYFLRNCLYCLIVATILDKNVKKNACSMSNFRTLPSKARFTQDTSPSPPPQKKNKVEVWLEYFCSRLNNIDQWGVGGGATMVPNSWGGCPVSKTVQHFLSKNVAFIILKCFLNFFAPQVSLFVLL